MKGYKNYKILSNKQIAKDVYELIVEKQNDEIQSGQFYMIKVPGKFLARPISVCDYDKETITFVYKVFGEGTKILSKMDQNVEMLGALGSQWKIIKNKKVAVVGGGVGTPAVYKLSQKLAKDNDVKVILGFKTIEDSFYEEKFSNHSKTYIVTEDDKAEYSGTVINVLDKLEFDYLYVCGPNPMIKAIAHKYDVDGQVSLEEHMACGIGICGGCNGSLLKKEESKKVCKEGPVFAIGSLDV